MKENNEGYVYILSSPNFDSIKIGGSDYPPLKRIREINTTTPYKEIGPWNLVDFRQVKNWRKVEHNLHYIFRDNLNYEIKNQKELFNVSIFKVSKALNGIDENEILYRPKIDRMFQDEKFLRYISKLFKFSGIYNWLNIQGVWTFVLFPGTNGGRYFTLNIGPHEIAFSTLGKKDEPQINMILVDRLILDYNNVINWISKNYGSIEIETYKKALPRSTSILFPGDFELVDEFLKLDGVRRALIAYWNEALLKINEKGKTSVYERYHNWNAVAKICEKLKNEDSIY